MAAISCAVNLNVNDATLNPYFEFYTIGVYRNTLAAKVLYAHQTSKSFL